MKTTDPGLQEIDAWESGWRLESVRKTALVNGACVNDACGQLRPCAFSHGPLITARRAAKKPVPELLLLGKRHHAIFDGLAFGARDRTNEDIESHDGLLSFAR
jgi:hypothetical protein